MLVNAPLQVLRRLGLAVGVLLLFAAVGIKGLIWWERRLPSEQAAREYFVSHRSAYVRLASLIRQHQEVRFVSSDGTVDPATSHARVLPELHELLREVGAKNVLIREDGSMEFAIWGFGCTICSDSYMGVRYLPRQYDVHAHPGWTAEPVKSLSSKDLPQEDDSVADGLYVVQIEPAWFIYRLEIH